MPRTSGSIVGSGAVERWILKYLVSTKIYSIVKSFSLWSIVRRPTPPNPPPPPDLPRCFLLHTTTENHCTPAEPTRIQLYMF